MLWPCSLECSAIRPFPSPFAATYLASSGPHTREKHFGDGAELVSFNVRRGSSLRESEVNVECHGPVAVAIKAADMEGQSTVNFPLYSTMLTTISSVKGVLRLIQP